MKSNHHPPTVSGEASRNKKVIKNKEKEEDMKQYIEEELRQFHEAFRDVGPKND